MAAQWVGVAAVAPALAPAPAAAPAPGDTPIMRIISQFKKHDPPKFNRDGEPMEAEKWLEEITEMTESLGVEGNEVRIQVAARQFQGSNVHWWRNYRGTINIATLT